MQPRSRRTLALLALAALSPAPAGARADPPSPLRQAAEEAATLRERRCRLQAEVNIYEWESECLRAGEALRLPGVGAGVSSFSRFTGLRRWVEGHLAADVEGRAARLARLAAEQRANEQTALDAWRRARLADADLVAAWANEERRLGVDLEKPSAWTWTDEIGMRVSLGGFTVHVLTAAVLAGLVSLGLGLHSVRRQLRRRTRFRAEAAAAAVALALLGVSGCGGAAGPAGAGPERVRAETARLAKEGEGLRGEVAKLEARKDRLDTEVKKERRQVVEGWIQLLSLTPGAGDGPLADGFRAAEASAFESLHAALVAAQTAELASADGLKVLRATEEKKARLAQRLGEEEGLAVQRGFVRAGWCLALAGMAFAPLWLIRRRVRNQLLAGARDCPCCATADTIEDKPVAQGPEPGDPLLRCTACQYEFPASYRKHARLAFPAVGISQSGKTHWLLAVYDKVKRHQVPVRAAFNKCESPADEEYDPLAEAVMERGQRPPGTKYALNWPLVFHMKERPLLARPSEQTMVNLFDLAGALMSRSVYKDVLRRRALNMDGFFLFLDPAQVDERSHTGQRIRSQIDAVRRFNDEMRRERGLGAGDALQVPVAVCISKLDLLTTMNPMENRARNWIRELRKTFADRVTLETVHKRSELCERVLSVMFPGWDVQRSLVETFGGRYLFFPVAPVGLEDEVLGKNDPSRGEIVCSSDPFGVLEPVLWLLHMHGYCVFD